MTELIEEQKQEIFSNKFYELWDENNFGEKDLDSSNPWGCPWYWDDGFNLLFCTDIE